MLALKSGVLAADAVHEAILARDFSPERFSGYATMLRQGIENMRKLVYAFYDPNFSFRKLIGQISGTGGRRDGLFERRREQGFLKALGGRAGICAAAG